MKRTKTSLEGGPRDGPFFQWQRMRRGPGTTGDLHGLTMILRIYHDFRDWFFFESSWFIVDLFVVSVDDMEIWWFNEDLMGTEKPQIWYGCAWKWSNPPFIKMNMHNSKHPCYIPPNFAGFSFESLDGSNWSFPIKQYPIWSMVGFIPLRFLLLKSQ